MDRIQPTLFAVQVALAALWRSWGVHPAAVIGHSMGEVAAAVVAGALSPADGAAVICRRSALLRQVTGGAMASVLLSAADVEADIAAAGADRVSAAVMTAEASTVISGDPDQIAALVENWHAREVAAALVEIDVASHSPYMDPILDRLRGALAGLDPSGPEIAFYSTVTSDPHDQRALDAGYGVDNLRQVVRFSGATGAALEDGHQLFNECTAHADPRAHPARPAPAMPPVTLGRSRAAVCGRCLGGVFAPAAQRQRPTRQRPRDTVASRTPAAWATARIPPRPNTRALAPSSSRRCRSSRCGKIASSFAASIATVSADTLNQTIDREP